jgi:hypothetical protein
MTARTLFIVAALVTTAACTGASPTTPTTSEAVRPAAAATLPFAFSTSDALHLQGGGGPKVRKVKTGTMTTTSTSMSGSMTLSGPRFDISGDWADGGSIGCQPCASGPEVIWTSASFTGSRGSATVDGVHYDGVYLSGLIKVSGTVVVPASTASTFTATFPFTMDDSAFLIGYASNPWLGPAQELFRLDLRGSGTASIELNAVPLSSVATVYTARSLLYAF